MGGFKVFCFVFFVSFQSSSASLSCAHQKNPVLSEETFSCHAGTDCAQLSVVCITLRLGTLGLVLHTGILPTRLWQVHTYKRTRSILTLNPFAGGLNRQTQSGMKCRRSAANGDDGINFRVPAIWVTFSSRTPEVTVDSRTGAVRGRVRCARSSGKQSTTIPVRCNCYRFALTISYCWQVCGRSRKVAS